MRAGWDGLPPEVYVRIAAAHSEAGRDYSAVFAHLAAVLAHRDMAEFYEGLAKTHAQEGRVALITDAWKMAAAAWERAAATHLTAGRPEQVEAAWLELAQFYAEVDAHASAVAAWRKAAEEDMANGRPGQAEAVYKDGDHQPKLL